MTPRLMVTDNPAGKLPGTKNHATRMAENLMEGAGETKVVREPGKAPAAKLTPWSGLRTEER